MKATMHFLGGCGTVTGSKTLIEVNNKKFLIDCGLFQGPKALRLLNWQPLDLAPEIDAVILTHAHLDHSGYLPKLVKDGFKGKIYCSLPTAELVKIMLLDSAHLQEEDAAFANTTKHSRHFPAEPLYTVAEAEACLHLLNPLEDNIKHSISDNVSFAFFRSGHILGSRFVQIEISDGYKNKVITFSGDVGTGKSLVIKGPIQIPRTDILITESTYGSSTHDPSDPSIALKELITEVYENNGVLVIPAFSVGRTQDILEIITQLKKHAQIPNIAVYVDSPMSLRVTEVYQEFKDELKSTTDNENLCYALEDAEYKAVWDADSSMLLCMQEGPFVVISAAGMLNGGRILHHLKTRLPSLNNIVLFVGYQAEETKGRLLQSGIPSLRIHHQEVQVNAKIITMGQMSAHADQQELLAWIASLVKAPEHIYINHGEEEPATALQKKIATELKIPATIASTEHIIEIF